MRTTGYSDRHCRLPWGDWPSAVGVWGGHDSMAGLRHSCRQVGGKWSSLRRGLSGNWKPNSFSSLPFPLPLCLCLWKGEKKWVERRGKKEEGRRRKKQKRRSSQTVPRADHVLVYIQWLLQWKGFCRLDRAVKGGGGASTVWQHAVCRLGVVDWDLPTRTCRLGVFQTMTHSSK